MRGKEFLIPKRKGTFRIVVYGGSTTVGSESKDDETYPARLEQILHERGYPDVGVINYGAHGKSLYWIAQQYFREVEKIEPDLVIINNIRNTFFDQAQLYSPYTDIVTPQRGYLIKVHLFLTDNLLLYRFIRRGIERFQFYRTVNPLVNNPLE